MFVLYVLMTLVTATGAALGAWQNFTRQAIPLAAAEQVKTPDYLHDVNGAIFLAAAAGLLVGLVIRPVGVAASVGLVAYFVLAVLAHLRVKDLHLVPPLVGLALSAGTLAATLAA